MINVATVKNCLSDSLSGSSSGDFSCIVSTLDLTSCWAPHRRRPGSLQSPDKSPGLKPSRLLLLFLRPEYSSSPSLSLSPAPSLLCPGSGPAWAARRGPPCCWARSGKRRASSAWPPGVWATGWAAPACCRVRTPWWGLCPGSRTGCRRWGRPGAGWHSSPPGWWGSGSRGQSPGKIPWNPWCRFISRPDSDGKEKIDKDGERFVVERGEETMDEGWTAGQRERKKTEDEGIREDQRERERSSDSRPAEYDALILAAPPTLNFSSQWLKLLTFNNLSHHSHFVNCAHHTRQNGGRRRTHLSARHGRHFGDFCVIRIKGRLYDDVTVWNQIRLKAQRSRNLF